MEPWRCGRGIGTDAASSFVKAGTGGTEGIEEEAFSLRGPGIRFVDEEPGPGPGCEPQLPVVKVVVLVLPCSVDGEVVGEFVVDEFDGTVCLFVWVSGCLLIGFLVGGLVCGFVSLPLAVYPSLSDGDIAFASDDLFRS